MFYYDMNVIRPDLSLNSTISYDYHNEEESKKQLLESFNSCFCLNKNFHSIRKEIFYHQQWDILKKIIYMLEIENQIKIKYVNEI